jgi:hypothetical protein
MRVKGYGRTLSSSRDAGVLTLMDIAVAHQRALDDAIRLSTDHHRDIVEDAKPAPCSARA